MTSSQLPLISNISPSGNDTLVQLQERKITWVAVSAITTVSIELSQNSGQSWVLIVSGTANDGSYNWYVTQSPSDSCLLRISDTQGNASAVSAKPFSIVIPEKPWINLRKPGDSDTLFIGESFTLQWESALVDSVRIELTADSGENWIVLAPEMPDTGSFSFVVPDVQTCNGFLRVRGSNQERISSSNKNPFCITGRVTDVENILSSKQFTIIPRINSHGAFSIVFANVAPGEIDCRLYSLTGRIVAQKKIGSGKFGNHIMDLNVNGKNVLSSGAHLLHVRRGKQTFKYLFHTVR